MTGSARPQALRSLRVLGRTIGRALDFVGTRAAHTTDANLALIEPARRSDARRAAARASLGETGALAAETLALWAGAEDMLLASIDGDAVRAWLDDVLAGPDGLLLLVPHLGNWELLNYWLAARCADGAPQGPPFTALYAPQRNPRLDRWLRARRERSGARLVPAGHAGLRRLVETLDAGGCAAVLPDQVPAAGRGVHAAFFGRAAYTTTLVRGLLRRRAQRVQVACLAALRTNEGFELVRVDVDAAAVAQADVQAAARALNTAVEDLVRQAPGQYQWEYKRFRNPPKGAIDPYKRRARSAE